MVNRCADGPRTEVSDWLTPAHPAATTARCVWTQAHAGVVVRCSDQQVLNHEVRRCRLRRAVEGGLHEHVQL